MSERDTLAALLRDEYELGDYWVSKSRLADAAYRGRDPMDDWRGLADRLIAAGVRLAPADTGLREAARVKLYEVSVVADPPHPSWRIAPSPETPGLREPYVLAQAARQAEYERAQRAEVVARAAADLIESMSWKAGASAYWVQTLGDDRALYERLRDSVAVWLAALDAEAVR